MRDEIISILCMNDELHTRLTRICVVACDLSKHYNKNYLKTLIGNNKLIECGDREGLHDRNFNENKLTM